MREATMINLYYTFVYKYLIYCHIVWLSPSIYYSIYILQKDVVGIICQVAFFNALTVPLFKYCKIVNYFQIYRYQCTTRLYVIQHWDKNFNIPGTMDITQLKNIEQLLPSGRTCLWATTMALHSKISNNAEL